MTLRQPNGWGWAAFSDVAVITPNLVDPKAWLRSPHIAPDSVARDTGKLLSYRTVREDGVTSAKHRFHAGQILYSKIRPYLNKCVLIDFDGLCSADMYPVSASIDIRYLHYYMLTGRFVSAVTKAAGSRTVLPKTNQAQLSGVPVPVAPLREQGRIVETLDSHLTRLDDATVTLERVQRNLMRYRASIFQAAVEGRLVPTEAELARDEGRSYEPASVLLGRILSERRRRWEEAEVAKMNAKGKEPKDDRWKANYTKPVGPDTTNLPDLPEGWCWSSLGELFEVNVGATPSRARPEYWDGDIPWVSSGEVAFCRISKTRETISSAGLRSSSTQLNPAGSVLLGMIGEGRTRGQAAILSIPACNNQNCAAIWVSEAGLPPEYVYYFLMGQYEVTRTRGSGNNQPALNKSRVQAIPIPLPPLGEVKRIVAGIETHESVIGAQDAALRVSLARIARLRQSILKWAFEGRLVDQDPIDEPASVLLERIRAERESADDKTPRKPRRPNVKTSKS
jgi:type I restriction enzyme S subunit